MAEQQGLTLGDLGTGLAGHRILAAVLGQGERPFGLAERLLPQTLPFIQQAAARFLGPLGGSGEVQNERSGAAARRQMDADVVGQATLLTHGDEQTAGHAHSQMGLDQPQRRGVGVAQRQGGATEQQHQLLGVLLDRRQGARRRGGGGQRRGGGRGGRSGTPPLRGEGRLQKGPRVLRELTAEHQHSALATEIRHQRSEIGLADLRKLLLHPERIVAVRTIAIELVAELVMGQLKGILALALQALQVQLPLQIQLIGLQARAAHHREQQRQQGVAVLSGTLEGQHQTVLSGLAAQAGAGPLDEIRQRFGIELAAAAGHQSSEQLMGAATAGGIHAAAATNDQPSREDRRARPVQERHGQTIAERQARGWGRQGGEAHAGTASSTKARAGSSRGRAEARSRSGLQSSSSSSGRDNGWRRPQRVLLPISPARAPADSRPKR